MKGFRSQPGFSLVLIFAFAYIASPGRAADITLSISADKGQQITVLASTNLFDWSPLTNFFQTEATTSFKLPAHDNKFFEAANFNFPRFNNYSPSILPVPLEQTPYFNSALDQLPDTYPERDGEDVRMYLKEGILYDHPFRQSSYALSLINSYRKQTNSALLDRARLHANRIIAYAHSTNGAWFIPYKFSWNLDPSHVLDPPWYSALAQGSCLSIFVNLYELTQDNGYLEAATNTFNGFKALMGQTDPWISNVDERGNLWLEEYAQLPDGKSSVLNGQIYSLWGLYDYYRLTRDPLSLILLQGAITTVKERLDFFRTPGYLSKYSIRFPGLSEKYHIIHVKLLSSLYSLTGDTFFAKAVDAFYTDHPDPTIPGKVILSGGQNGYQFDAYGEITATNSVMISPPASFRFGSKDKVIYREGVWLLLEEGPLAGYWVKESPEDAVVTAIFQPVTFSPSRLLTLKPGVPGYTFYKYFPDGTRQTGAYIYHPTTATYNADAIAFINSRLHVRIAEGNLQGYWLPMTIRSTLE